MWIGRDRSRAYYGLMLFLLGAVIATFAAQDLLRRFGRAVGREK